MVRLYDLDVSPSRPRLDLGSIDNTEDDDDLRSPRTPIYQPTSPFSSSLSPFDPAKLFSSLSAPLSPRGAAPTNKALPPPSDPLAWVWQCHLCRSRWALGVTRRCLVDGHLYCSGETSQPNLKKKKKGQSCSSEFDYVGWKDWSAWKRDALKTMSNPRTPRGCEKCEFPSQCRYSPAESKLVDGQTSSSPMTGIEYSSSKADDDVARYYSNENITFESILAQAEAAGKSVQSRMTDFYKADPKRPKSGKEKRLKSVLSSIAEEASKTEIGTGLHDLVMPLVDFCCQETKEKRKSFP